MKLQEMPKLCQFAIKVLIYRVKPLLKLFLGELADRIVGRVVVHVWK
jgi:hypothetical protein